MSDTENTAFPGLRRIRRPAMCGAGLPGVSVGRVPVPAAGTFVDPLSQLVVAEDPLRSWPGLGDQDLAEAFDAAHEDADGRLPHERGSA